MNMTQVGAPIAAARRDADMTQEELAGAVGVSPQAVSKWENGHNLPDLENLLLMAEILNKPYSMFLAEEKEMPEYQFRDRLFQEGNMFTRMKSFALAERLDETYRALHYMRERHTGQFRRGGKYSTEKTLYINHPLTMACQAAAFGLRDDALLAALLLHDVVEDTGVTAEELPFCEEVRALVALVSFSVPQDMTKKEAKDAYYARIAQNGKACLIKAIDRCNNVSTMAGCFTREKLVEYTDETQTYILPLLTVLKHEYPQYSDAAFLLKYQIISLLECVKYLLVE